MDTFFFLFKALTVFVSYHEVIAKSSLQIVNGTAAKEGEFPYMVELRGEYDNFLCGGAIIRQDWIVTAARCVVDGQIASIVYGTNKLYDTNDGDSNTSIAVKNWFQHPNFNYTPEWVSLYDVGLLQLEEEIPFSGNAQPIQLAEETENSDIPFHVEGVLSGWGVNYTTGNPMMYLQKIYLQLLTDEECTEKINNYSQMNLFNSTHHLCTDNYYNGQCYGDEGGPIVINNTIFGIVSWSVKPCGIVPGAYSRITNPEYRAWIRNITAV